MQPRPFMRRFLVSFVLILGLASRAEAVSLRDLVDLARQGMSDDLLIALVEAEKSVFHLNASDVKELKAEGLSDRLLIHLLQTPALRPAPEPRLLMADAKPPRSEPRSQPAVVIVNRVEQVAVPVYVPVQVERRGRDRHDDDRKDDKKKDETPVYWGYGGKLRPGSWKDR
jgi:hypothetical protein